MKDAAAFIERWSPSGGGERSNYQLFLSELCDQLSVPKPEPATADDTRNAYVFDRSIPRQEADGSTTTNFIDLYKRGCFICETKQGVAKKEAESLLTLNVKQKLGHGIRGSGAWDTAMEKARNQAEHYARSLPAFEGRPPFLLIVDVGYSIELFAEFTCTGGTYVRFPDPKAHRIYVTELRDEKNQETLKKIWTEPLSLDPARHSAKVTREIADHLAKLARSFEMQGHDPQIAAEFIMRCIFTMFAEDVRLLPENSFKKLLESLKGNIRGFPTMVGALWRDMAAGTSFSTVIREKVLHFNGGLFETAQAMAVTGEQLELLIEAAQADWRDVEPAIFGTLLERALLPRERHKLGAHYTPRAYVERLVFPTVIDPLRQEWEAVKTAAAKLQTDADAAENAAGQLDAESRTGVRSGGAAQRTKEQAVQHKKLFKGAAVLRRNAIDEVRRFHHALCKTRVLDPACGSGNFLYVTMEHMKRLEGEVLELLSELGDQNLEAELREFKVRPHQFIGLEINPWAVPIAELVLWIGYLQWHFRTSEKAVPDDPVISKEHSIRKQDAVLAYDRVEMVTDERGKPVSRWDGHTTKPHPVTGKEVPDETARVPMFRYLNPRKAEWPEADYVVGNPPFLGSKRMRESFGEGYTDCLLETWEACVPGAADLVFYWWHKAAELVRAGRIKQFGFITTNSLSQETGRKVTEPQLNSAKNSVNLRFAIPDHPWIDSGDGAAVRISMTVGSLIGSKGVLCQVIGETVKEDGEHEVTLSSAEGVISSKLGLGAKVSSVVPLRSNSSLCWQGCKLVGSGFQVSPGPAERFIMERPENAARLKSYWAGSDITQKRRSRYVIDFTGMSKEEAQSKHPELYQHVLDHVYPERAQNRDRIFREKWWLFGRRRPELREALVDIRRYIVTCEVAKHRTFMFLDWPQELIDGSVMAVASEDAYILGIVSSQVHVLWTLSTGGRLEDRPRYQTGPSFDPFPFPTPDDAARQRIRALGEQLDAHRKRQQALHPGLTLTGMYNVLEKLRAAESLSRRSRHKEAQTSSEQSETRDLVSYQLTAKEKEIHEQGLVSVLKQIHDELDAAVFAAYGWSRDLSDQEVLERLVALNHERAQEEKRGLIRWLRPDFQNPGATTPTSPSLPMEIEESSEAKEPGAVAPRLSEKKKQLWPKTLAKQVEAVRAALESVSQSVTAAELARQFQGGPKDRIAEILETLAALGKARETGDSRFQV